MKNINYILYHMFTPLVTYMIDNYTIFKVVPVVGRADDLLWIQLVHFGTLFILLAIVFLLLLVYVLSNILSKYQYYIPAKFYNKFIINFFINKFTSIYLPILILIIIGLSICVTHSLVTHPIPFWEAGIDITKIFFSK